MADTNENQLFPSMDDNEQFMSSENFLQADTASDWDALANRGNSNVTDTMSKWERDSLYVKFDPLVAAKKDSAPTQGQPDPFVFKAPKLPAPFHQPKLEHISESIANASDLSEANSSYQTATDSPNMNEINELGSPKPNGALNDPDNSFYTTADEEDLNRTVIKVSDPSARSKRPSLRNSESPTPIKKSSEPIDIDVSLQEEPHGDNEIKDLNQDATPNAEESFNGNLDDSFTACFSKMNIENERRESLPVDMHEQSLDVKFEELMIQDESVGLRTPEKSIIEQAPPSAVKSFPTTPTKLGSVVGEGDCERLDGLNDSLAGRAFSPASIYGEETDDRRSPIEDNNKSNHMDHEDIDGENSMNLSRNGYPNNSSLGHSDVAQNISSFDESSIHRSSNAASFYKPSPPAVSKSKHVQFQTCGDDGRMSPGLNRSLPSAKSGENVLSPRYDMNKSLPHETSSLRSAVIMENGKPDLANTPFNATGPKSPQSVPHMAAENGCTNVDRNHHSQKSKKQIQHSAKLARIAQLKESISQMTLKLEDQKKSKLNSLSKVEMDLHKNSANKLKQSERLEKVIQDRQAASLEKIEAGKQLEETEARFADMLMLYEKMKNATAVVERNHAILLKRQEILTDTLKKREARNQQIEDQAMEVFERMQRDFDNRVKDKDSENMKLKAKIRMCEVKTLKLEGEIQQVDRESEKLRALCEEFTHS